MFFSFGAKEKILPVKRNFALAKWVPKGQQTYIYNYPITPTDRLRKGVRTKSVAHVNKSYCSSGHTSQESTDHEQMQWVSAFGR